MLEFNFLPFLLNINATIFQHECDYYGEGGRGVFLLEKEEGVAECGNESIELLTKFPQLNTKFCL